MGVSPVVRPHRALALAALFVAACVGPQGTGDDAGVDANPAGDGPGPVVDMVVLPPDLVEPGPDLAGTCTRREDCAGALQACCGGRCIDVGSDPSNCGDCGKVCDPSNGAAVCAMGSCGVGACQAGWGDCNQDPGDGCETNLRVDPANCTMCGARCDIANALTGCSDGCYIQACNFGFDDCNGDPTDGCETTTLSDAKNCGTCGTVCVARPNAQVACIFASCALKSCTPGYLDCDLDPKNGCEVNSATDAANCGACGTACPPNLVCKNSSCTCPNCSFPNASSKCINNVCVFDKCSPGFADCDGKPANGCEVNIGTDPNNCGACGKVCPMGNLCIGQVCSMIVVTDTSWKETLNAPAGWQQPGFNDAGWVAAFDEGPHGTAPWNTIPAFTGTTAHWIWYYDSRNASDTSTVYFRRTFTATNPNATLVVTADDNYIVYLDGMQVAFSNDVWSTVHTWNLKLTAGHTYVMAISATNTGGPGGLLADMR